MIAERHWNIIAESGSYFIDLAIVLVPLFIGASFLVGLAKEYLPPERVESILRAHDGGVGNAAAAGLGAVTPFCSCSTVPILAGLLGAGAPLGLSFSFLLASPIVNWIAILLLLGLFGASITIAYIMLALTTAVIGGIIIGRLDLEKYVKDVKITTQDREITTDGGTNNSTIETNSTKTHKTRITKAGKGALSFFWDTLPYLIVGMGIGALIHGAVPQDILQQVAGPDNPLATPIAAVVGAPVYIGMSGMLPIASSLFDQGIPIGTVMAFVIGGAGVSIPNLILLNKLFDRRLLAIYAGIVLTIGITIGVTFNTIFH